MVPVADGSKVYYFKAYFSKVYLLKLKNTENQYTIDALA